jgi:4'-phosphopantetheinyl transferase EntD
MISEVLPAGVAAVEAIGDAPDATLLPEEEAALGPVAERRRREFTIARSCARRALAALGVPATPVLSGPRRQPAWPAGIVGSITHCPDYCAAAVARRERVATIGIDAEEHASLPEGVLDMIALDEERAWLRARSGTGVCWDRVLFSAKESLFKAWFPITGRWLDFRDALVTVEPESGRFSARLRVPGAVVGGQTLTAFGGQTLTAFGGRYLVREGYVLTAVAVELSSAPVRR